MVDDPVVRSVRVAAALCDRFAELQRGPTTVAAHKGHSALVGFKGEDEAFSLRVNEAQQIYPEIWSHLDDARKALATRGVDLTAFDMVRETERRFKPTGVDIDMNYQQFGVATYGIEQTVKKANFNANGLLRARSAIQAIQNATPTIDWVAIAKAEANDPNIAAFRRATIMKRIYMFVGLIAVLGIPFWYVLWSRHEERVKRDKWRKNYEEQSYQPPTPTAPPPDLLPVAQQAQLAASTKQTVDHLDAALKSWSTITAPDALAALKPQPAPCPTAITPAPKDIADKFIQHGTEDPAFKASDFDAWLASDIASGRPIGTDAISDRAAIAKSALHTFETKAGVKRTIDSLEGLETPYIFIVIDRDDEPEVTKLDPKLEFKPGHLVAHAYVYSITDARIACAGVIDVKSSAPAAAAAYLEGVDSEGRADKILHRELEVRIREALGKSLHEIGLHGSPSLP